MKDTKNTISAFEEIEEENEKGRWAKDTSDDATYVFALGGIEEIGKNTYVIEHKDEIWIVDAGVKFADENLLPGIDGIIPSYKYLVDNEHLIKGMIVTHAHEDHIGGIPYLLKQVKIPRIYAGQLAIELIKRKYKFHKELPDPSNQFEILEDNKILKSKHFEIEFFRVCHSVPLAFGASFKTPDARVVTAGDFKFDFSNLVDQTDMQKIAEISKKGIDLFLCETTNALTPGFGASEYFIIQELSRIMDTVKGRTFITTFASSLGRIENIIAAAVEKGKKICILGKAMDANINSSIKIGLLRVDRKIFIDTKDLSDYRDDEIVIILTGSQGEPSAALNLMANGKHPSIILKSSDTIVFSSNTIPGNLLSVETLINRLHKANVNIIKNGPLNKTHASGHASQTEQALMMRLVKPKYVMPIHGEHKMLTSLKSHSSFSGVKEENYLQVVNGQKIRIKSHVAEATDQFVPAHDVHVDGKKADESSSKLLGIRNVLSLDGVFSVVVSLNRSKKVVWKQPTLLTRGCFHANSSHALMTKLSYLIKENLEKEMNRTNSNISNFLIRNVVDRTVSNFIWRNKKKKPYVRVTIFDIEEGSVKNNVHRENTNVIQKK